MPKKIDQKAEKRARNEIYAKKYKQEGKKSPKELRKLKNLIRDTRWIQTYEEKEGRKFPTKQDIIRHDQETRQRLRKR